MLELVDVRKTFRGISESVLSGINLKLSDGEFCVIIGSNGSGKSTLISSILGEVPIDSGNIIVDGCNLTHRNKNDVVGCVSQNIDKGTVSEMTLLENMALSQMRNYGPSFRFYNKRINAIMQSLKESNINLQPYIHTPLSALSGGQRQMIATIMAISSRPKILLLDEHTSALDPKTHQLLMHYTAEQIRTQNITTLLVTHRMEDAVQYGDRLIKLHHGKIVLDISGKEKANLSTEKLLSYFQKYEYIGEAS